MNTRKISLTVAVLLATVAITSVASETTAQDMLQLCIPPAVAQVIS